MNTPRLNTLANRYANPMPAHKFARNAGTMLRVERERAYYTDYLAEGLSPFEKHVFEERLPRLALTFNGDWFESPAHRARFQRACRELRITPNNHSPKYVSILFLVSAHSSLWKMAEPHLYHSSLEFDELCFKSLSTKAYSYYLLAKSIHLQTRLLSMDDISDESIINDRTFKTLIHAKLIAQFGGGILSTKR